MTIRFPKRRDDGTFTVRARFTISDPHPGLMPLVHSWVGAWLRQNRTWFRLWRSDVIREERLELATEFSSDPRVESVSDERFVIVFEGVASSTLWRDWAAYLLNDFRRHFRKYISTVSNSDSGSPGYPASLA